MEFDPLVDYGNFDLTDEINLAYWKFAELIKTLITLSSDAERQSEIIGYGLVCDEMVEDFELYFTLAVELYKRFNLLTDFQIEKLSELEYYFDSRSGVRLLDFWNDSLLETSEEWQIFRQMAKNILELLGMQNLKIEFERKESINQKIIVQSTKIRLVKK
ncbi:hypothetical protein [Flavobacterium anhuiense]|uniref:hypothetical protein n=1 Tax=Flavobacterium anhuiense TaxID=459526 RepID=UPI003D98024D